MKQISWTMTKKEASLITEIVRRALKLRLANDPMELNMDITAVHVNDIKLDLGKLLKADDFNFMHDVCGIQRHINRANGHLLDYFLPRAAKPVKSHAV